MVSWTNPTNGGSSGLWGSQLNGILDQIKTALNGTVRVTTPEQYHAAGDGVTDDLVALNGAMAAGGLVMLDDKKTYAYSGKLTVPAGCVLYGRRDMYALTGATGAKLKALNTFSADRMVEFAAGTVGGGMVGVNLQGLGNIASALAGVVVNDGCYNTILAGNWIGAMSDSPVRFAGQPVACLVERNVLGWDVTARTLTAPTGVLHLTGSDHYIGFNEVNGGPSHTGGPSNGYDRVSYPGNFYRAGVYVGGHNIDFAKTVPEFCDTAWYVDTMANLNRWLGGARSDYSAGHGAVILGNDNDFGFFQVNGAGFAYAYDGILYDGTYIAGAAARNTWDVYRYDNGGAPQVVRYGWNDTVAGNGAANENKLLAHRIQPQDCFYDTVGRVEPRSALVLDGAGPAKDRPASRVAQGTRWYDTDRLQPTWSTGSLWVDDFQDPSGNVMTPRAAEGIGGTLQVGAADSTCTVAGSPWASASVRGQKMVFGLLAGVVAAAAGVTAGYVNAGGVADPGGHFTPIVGGADYTYVMQSIAETTGATTISMVVNYFDSTNTYLGSSPLLAATGGGSNSTAAVTDSYWQHVTAPATAAYAQPIFRWARAGMVLGEAHWFNGLAIVPDPTGKVTKYVKP